MVVCGYGGSSRACEGLVAGGQGVGGIRAEDWAAAAALLVEMVAEQQGKGLRKEGGRGVERVSR